MQTSLLWTALLMGLVGGPHCVAMCGAACGGVARTAGPRHGWGLLSFQLGRLLGYASLGVLAAGSLQGLGWLTVQSAALRPVWSLFHLVIVALGLGLLWHARQPIWLAQGAKQVWHSMRAHAQGHGLPAALTPLVFGGLWALLPCGLLYSALALAALSAHALNGALVMSAFALGSGVSLALAAWGYGGWHAQLSGPWGVRLAGATLALSSGWALWMGLAHNTAPWCSSV